MPGSACYIFGPTGPAFGPFSVALDGQSIGQYNASTTLDTYDTLLFFVSGLSDTAHQIVLTNLDDGSLLAIDYIVANSNSGQGYAPGTGAGMTAVGPVPSVGVVPGGVGATTIIAGTTTVLRPTTTNSLTPTAVFPGEGQGINVDRGNNGAAGLAIGLTLGILALIVCARFCAGTRDQRFRADSSCCCGWLGDIDSGKRQVGKVDSCLRFVGRGTGQKRQLLKMASSTCGPWCGLDQNMRHKSDRTGVVFPTLVGAVLEERQVTRQGHVRPVGPKAASIKSNLECKAIYLLSFGSGVQHVQMIIYNPDVHGAFLPIVSLHRLALPNLPGVAVLVWMSALSTFGVNEYLLVGLLQLSLHTGRLDRPDLAVFALHVSTVFVCRVSSY